MKFKPGDKVRCIRQSEFPEHKLDVGQVYTVAEQVYPCGVSLIENPRRTSAGHRFTHSASRFELVAEALLEEAVKDIKDKQPEFRVGDVVRCKDADGYEQFGFRAGELYTVTYVLPGGRGPTLLNFKELAKYKGGTIFAHRFELVSRAQELANFEATLSKVVKRVGPALKPDLSKPKPQIGTLDEYGPVNVPANPIFNAIGKRWPTNQSDVLIQLDELTK